MCCLVYCILKAPTISCGSLTGLMGKPVSFITSHRLVAALSECAFIENAPSIADLLAYARVVEEIFRLRPIIPMRYGCFLDGIPAIHRILEEREHPYTTLLDELEGHVEMGIRILLPERTVKPQRDSQSKDGSHYLTSRKAFYRMRDEDSQYHKSLLDRFIQAFSELHSKHRTEMTTRDGAVILSLYSLIPVCLINQFRATFQQVLIPEGTQTLISGPWPPYNFSFPDLSQRAALLTEVSTGRNQ